MTGVCVNSVQSLAANVDISLLTVRILNTYVPDIVAIGETLLDVVCDTKYDDDQKTSPFRNTSRS
jgi:hypothetical protein